MRKFRVVLYGVPPLLADLIRQVVVARFEQRLMQQRAHQPSAEPLSIDLSIIPANAVIPSVGEQLRRIAPHVVIHGADAALASHLAQSAPHQPRVLTLSADLAWVHGPGPADSTVFSPDTLVDRLCDIAAGI